MSAGAALKARPARRVGFLFNHDQIHQVAHSLPIAMAMAEGGGEEEILILTTTPRLAAEVRRLCPGVGSGRLRLVELAPGRISRVLTGLLGRLAPVGKLLIYRDNLALFRSLDLLVVAEKTSLVLKSRYGLKDLRILHTRHGAGDRAIGFDPASAGFDHVLCSGPKIRDRLIAEAGLRPQDITIVGYPKFDLAPQHPRLPKGFDPARPTVLYNPHPSPHLSSWYKEGRAVLEFFRTHPEYQLIFAPHVMLFERKLVITVDRLSLSLPGRIARRYWKAPNIHIDLGSPASTDMTYTSVADIYLGDVSSQIYEFLRHPRPCLFLNAHGVAWQGDPNYLHWQSGPVIGGAEGLEEGLAEAMRSHEGTYLPIQRALFAQSFTLTAEPSAIRAARAIRALMGSGAEPPG